MGCRATGHQFEAHAESHGGQTHACLFTEGSLKLESGVNVVYVGVMNANDAHDMIINIVVVGNSVSCMRKLRDRKHNSTVADSEKKINICIYIYIFIHENSVGSPNRLEVIVPSLWAHADQRVSLRRTPGKVVAGNGTEFLPKRHRQL